MSVHARAVTDAVIVAASLRVDGATWNPVNLVRARKLMEAVRSVRT